MAIENLALFVATLVVSIGHAHADLAIGLFILLGEREQFPLPLNLLGAPGHSSQIRGSDVPHSSFPGHLCSRRICQT